MLIFEWVRLDVRERAHKFFGWFETPATWRHFKGLADYLLPMLKLAVNEDLHGKVPSEVADKMMDRRSDAFAEQT